MNHLLRLMLVITLTAGTFIQVRAQGVTTAKISGTVINQADEPLVGASVVAVHEPSGTRYGITARSNGFYTLANLRVGGPYSVEFSFLGYQTVEITDIYLSLGQNLPLDVELMASDLNLDEIEIVAEADPIMNGERTGAGTQISGEQIRNLPTISRSAADYYRLSPVASGNSFGGRNDQFNNFSLDGSIFNNPFGLDAATPGGQTDAQPVSLDAIEQIQVAVAPYDVTQAGFTGASINAVTKSGTNEFTGTVFGFFRNADLTGGKVAGTDIVVPDLSQLQAGFSIGGPIIKNKLFFFANFEMQRRTDAGSNFQANRVGAEGQNVSRVEASDLELVSDVLFNRFGYETGAYENYTHRTNNEKGIIKLDLAINDKNTLSMSYNFLNAFQEKNAHPSALGRRGPDAVTLQFFNSGYRINNVIHSGIVELRSIIGSQFSNKLQVGYTAFRDTRDPFSTPMPVININRDGLRYIVAGHEPFSINNRLDQDVFQITNNFNIYAGAHTFTIGASLERFDFNNSFNLGVYDPFVYIGGTFGSGFPSVDSLVTAVESGGLDEAVAAAQATFDGNTENDTWALAETNVGQLGVYIQDEWQATTDLKLIVGVRMDLPLYFNTPEKIQENIDRNCCYDPEIAYFDTDGNELRFNSTELPQQRPLISPRFGFNWDAGGKQTTQLRGGTGLFSGRLPFVWIGNQVANVNSFFYNITEPNFRFPQVWRSNLGIDQKVGEWIASVDLIYTKDINGMIVRNFGLKPPTGTLAGVDNRPVYVDADKGAANAYVFSNTNVGYSFNATFQLQRNWGNDFYTSIAYNFLDAQDASSIEAEISSDAYERNPAINHVNEAILAPSLYGNRHRIIGTGYKKFTYGNSATTIALFFEYAQGGRFTYTYSGDLNNDASGLNDLIYIPTESEISQMMFDDMTGNTVDAQRTGLEAFIDQDEYLSANRGTYAEKYAILSPWFSSWDVRILQDLSFEAGEDPNTLQLSIDILNIGNLINSNWGVRQLPTTTQPIGVNGFDGATGEPIYAFDPGLTSTFTNDFSLLSRWQVQVGLRYSF